MPQNKYKKNQNTPLKTTENKNGGFQGGDICKMLIFWI
jgi:hypothetical protein